MKKYFVVLFCSIASASRAQDLPPVTEQQMEHVSDANESENPQDDAILLQLEQFKKHPLNVNAVSSEDLQAIGLLTDLQIASLERYRKVFGDLVHIYELQAIPCWDVETIRRILPFITVASTITVRDQLFSRFRLGEHAILFRSSTLLEKSKRYDRSYSSGYTGNPFNLHFRYRYQYKNILSMGLTGDKDAGEPLFNASPAGLDFYSFHLFVKKLGPVQSLAIGDFTVNLGQGLIQWQSLGFGKSAEVINIKRQSPVLLPYRSSGEFNFNRGLGMTLKKKNLEATVFVSYKKITANVINDSSRHFSSMSTYGLHRTPAERSDRNSVSLNSFGGNLTYRSTRFKAGLNTVIHRFDIPFEKVNEPYHLYTFRGTGLFNSSMDYSYTHRNIHLFGEAAMDKYGHPAIINGALVSVDPKVDVSLLYRNTTREYQCLFASAFVENNLPVNEKGMYTGVSIRPMPGWHLTGFADFFEFPWLKFRVNAPSHGYGYLLQLTFRRKKQLEIYGRYQARQKSANDNSSPMNSIVPQVKQNIRLHVSAQISRLWSVRARTEIISWNTPALKENGAMAYLEAIYRRSGCGAYARVQYFGTGGYDSRIYAYESDLQYSFSIPAVYDNGWRYYLHVHMGAFRKIDLWLKWSQTIYSGKQKIGTGQDEIDGNKRSEIKFQLQYNLE